MAKEAGKTGNPHLPIVPPPVLGGPMGQNANEKFVPMPQLGHPPMPNLSPPTGLMNTNFPPLEPLPLELRHALHGGIPPSLGEPGGDEHNLLEKGKAGLAAGSGMNGSPFVKKTDGCSWRSWRQGSK